MYNVLFMPTTSWNAAHLLEFYLYELKCGILHKKMISCIKYINSLSIFESLPFLKLEIFFFLSSPEKRLEKIVNPFGIGILIPNVSSRFIQRFNEPNINPIILTLSLEGEQCTVHAKSFQYGNNHRLASLPSFINSPYEINSPKGKNIIQVFFFVYQIVFIIIITFVNVIIIISELTMREPQERFTKDYY